MKRIHFTDKYLINPLHPVTISLIGVGGTGSQVLTHLARMNKALIALDHPGIHVKAFDNDIVTESNIGRQLFSECDIGLSKSQVLISRINRYFGYRWESFQKQGCTEANIIISCVDTIESRKQIDGLVKHFSKQKAKQPYEMPLYWLDFGNTQNTGQVVLGTIQKIGQPKSEMYTTVASLPNVMKEFKNFKGVNESDQGPSCSLADALHKQDLFVNSTLSNIGCNILWKLISEAKIEHRGAYMNLKSLTLNPIKV